MCNNFYKEFLKEKKGITAFIRNFLRKKMCNNCYKEFLKGDGLVFPPIEPNAHSVQLFQVGLNQ